MDLRATLSSGGKGPERRGPWVTGGLVLGNRSLSAPAEYRPARRLPLAGRRSTKVICVRGRYFSPHAVSDERSRVAFIPKRSPLFQTAVYADTSRYRAWVGNRRFL